MSALSSCFRILLAKDNMVTVRVTVLLRKIEKFPNGYSINVALFAQCTLFLLLSGYMVPYLFLFV